MKLVLFTVSFLLLITVQGFSNYNDSTEKDAPTAEQIAELSVLVARLDSIEKTIKYENGQIKLANGGAMLNVPQGFKFINGTQARYIIEDLWQNLSDPLVIGMVVPDSFHVNSLSSSWVFVVSYEGMGYVKDGDADEINYDDLLKNMKEGQRQANLERTRLGYGELNIVGWASKPFYDKQNKVLHWAKELNVAGEEGNTLNYDVRVLGRKGVLSLNAIAEMNQLDEVKKNIPSILKMASFEKGNTYAEFDPKVDEVAAWTIGGLVAGKILLKAGVLAGLLKFWKLIAIGVVAAGSFIVKLIRRKKTQEEYAVEPVITENQNSSTP